MPRPHFRNRPSAFDTERAEYAVRELPIAVGEDPDREGRRDTPARVAKAYQELQAGLRQEPEDDHRTVRAGTAGGGVRAPKR